MLAARTRRPVLGTLGGLLPLSMADESKAAASASGEDDTTLSSTTVDTMLPTALDFAACAGLVSGQSADTPGFTKHVPFALTPSKVHTVVRLRSRVYPTLQFASRERSCRSAVLLLLRCVRARPIVPLTRVAAVDVCATSSAGRASSWQSASCARTRSSRTLPAATTSGWWRRWRGERARAAHVARGHHEDVDARVHQHAGRTAAADEFSGHLLDILKRVHSEGITQV